MLLLGSGLCLNVPGSLLETSMVFIAGQMFRFVFWLMLLACSVRETERKCKIRRLRFSGILNQKSIIEAASNKHQIYDFQADRSPFHIERIIVMSLHQDSILASQRARFIDSLASFCPIEDIDLTCTMDEVLPC